MKRYIDFGIRLMTMIFMILSMNSALFAQVRVVNMMPKAQSGETNQDSEPNIAVNPADPLRIAGSAFTPDPMGGTNAPIYVSIDGGNTWFMNLIVPGGNSLSGTGDITIRFGGTSGILYTGILRGDSFLRLNILRTADFTSPAPMVILVDRTQVDQPYVQATTVLSGVGVGNDRVYVGNNDFSVPGPGRRTATIDQSLDAAAVVPPFTISRIETRNTGSANQDGPPIRPAIHPNGRIYAAFYHWDNFDGTSATADVVVVRDDNWGIGASPFTSIIDGDGNAGVRVATGLTVPWANFSQVSFGQERFVGSNISIAVDPLNSDRVYLAWADRVGTTDYTLHVRRSTDGGMTWSADLLTITNATNPALTINSDGKVAFLYQQISGTGAGQRWETHFRRSLDGSTWDDMILARPLAGAPATTFIPYLGDYVHVMAVGRDFYGIFSANNTPDNANFPNGVVYQRNADFSTSTLLDTDNITSVPISIDPFFFMVEERAADLAISKTVSPATVNTGADLTYTITITNHGPNDAESITVTDNLPSTTSFQTCSVMGGVGGACVPGPGNNRTITFASLAASASATIQLTARVDCSLSDGTMIANSASVSSTTTDPQLSNNDTGSVTATAFNPPPVIVCPPDQNAVTVNPGDMSVMVTYPLPDVTDNCPGATVVCTLPSGSDFPLGTTSVSCTVTDSGGKMESCSFNVTVWDVCLQDDKSGDILYFNSFTGDYLFVRCDLGGLTIRGKGMITRTGCLTKLDDAVVSATLDRCIIAPLNRGSASIKPGPFGARFYINDSNTENNTCACP